MQLPALLGLALAMLAGKANGQGSVTVSRCSAVQAFDTAWLSCSTCTALDPNKEPDASTGAMTAGIANAGACRCAAGYREVEPTCDATDPNVCPATTCTDCVALGLAASADRRSCMACPSDGPLDTARRECVCSTAGYVLRDDGAMNATLGVQHKRCAPCPTGQRAFFPTAAGAFGASAYTCQSCPDSSMTLAADGSCTCPSTHSRIVGTVGVGPDYCLESAALSSLSTLGFPPADAASLTFRDVQQPASATSTSNGVAATLVMSNGEVVANPLAGRSLVSPGPSLVVRYYYPRAAARCLQWRGAIDSPHCHALANLCVLSMYAASAPPCALYQLLVGARSDSRGGWRGWVTGMPLLYFSDPGTVLSSVALAQEMSFDDTVRASSEDTLRFVLAAYSLNGTFLGLRPLTNQLAYCGAAAPTSTGQQSATALLSSFDDPEWTSFGYGVTSVVSCNLRGLLSGGAGVNTTEFYEPFFVDVSESLKLAQASTAGDGLRSTADALSASLPLSLYPVPVRVVNYRGASGQTPNADAYANTPNTGDDVLTRRFVLYDRVSAATSTTGPNSPEILRYASRILLSIRTQSTSRAKLLPPIITVEYAERRAADIQAGTDSLNRDAVEFRVMYEADQREFWTAATVIFAIAQTMAFGFAFLRMVNWNRKAVRTREEGAWNLLTVGRFLVYAAHGYSHAAFWVAAIMCWYWVVFFKLQARVFSLLPEDEPGNANDSYSGLSVILGTALFGQAFRVGELMWEQCSVDIFFVDWEKPRGAMVTSEGLLDEGEPVTTAALPATGAAAPAGDHSLPAAGTIPSKYPPVSIWRTLFMANEWSELATARRISVPLTYSLLAVVLVSADQQWVATARPTADNVTPGAVNPALQFGIATFWFLIIVGLEIVLVWAVLERFVEPSASLQFIDLCTVAKISVVMLDEKYHGFYLHCDAPYDYADADMRMLVHNLTDEAGTVRSGRGLRGGPAGSEDVQAFELFLPAVWRRRFDEHYRRLDERLAEHERRSKATTSSTLRGQQASQGSLLGGVDREMASLKHDTAQTIARFIKGFVIKDSRSAGLTRVFRERTYFQRFFGTPPDIEAENQSMGMRRSADDGVSVFMVDRDNRFETLIFRGVEWDLLLLSLLLFSFVHVFTADPVLSAFLAVLLDHVLCVVRVEWGRKNIASKTLVDDRFLV
jgi:meckelin